MPFPSRRRPTGGIRLLALALLAAMVAAALPVSPAGAATTVTVVAEADADATLAEDDPGRNFGSADDLLVDKSPRRESLVRFTVAGLAGPVVSAQLRLRVTDLTPEGPEVYRTGNGWDEHTVTWSDRPTPSSGALDAAGGLEEGDSAAFDVSGAVTGDGTYSFVLVPRSSNGVDFHSREASADPPQLVVEVGVSEPDPGDPGPGDPGPGDPDPGEDPPPGAGETVTVTAGADARVVERSPNTNEGSASYLEVDGSPIVESLLRFDVGELGAPVERATLELFATDKTKNGPEVYPTATDWAEHSVTWADRPERTGPVLDDAGAIADDSWVAWDVTAVVTGPGRYSFGLAGDSSDGADFRSREASADRPRLVLHLGTPAGPDTTPPQTTITSGPAGTVGHSTATFTFEADEPAGFHCSLDGAPASPCTSPVAYADLDDGPHTFAVAATDGAGNADPTPAVRSWTVDPSLPGPSLEVITTLAGDGKGFAGDGGPADEARLRAPRTMAADAAANVYVVDTDNHRVRRISASGIITTIAGTGTAGFSGDGGPATEARLDSPHGIDVDGGGNVFVADAPNHRIRKITPSGFITTVAGTGRSGYNGDGIPATEARLSYPKGVEIGPDGALYIGDANNHRVRRVASDGVITTVAGTGSAGYSGDGGPATSARFNKPRNLVFDRAGNLYVADDLNNVVRRISPAGTVTTVAGSGEHGDSGDGGPAREAELGRVRDVAVDAAGNLYIADEEHDRIRRVDPDGRITTFAGTGSGGFSGDGGHPAEARISGPRGVAVTPWGDVLIADTGNHRIRRVS